MASDYTELTKEAKTHGGPDDMRKNYMLAGALIIVGSQFAAKGIGWSWEKVQELRTKAKRTRAVAISRKMPVMGRALPKERATVRVRSS